MAESLEISFGDAVDRAAQDLAGMSGVVLAKAQPAVVRLWEARGLALHHLAGGDMAEALKVMDAAQPAARSSPIPATNQPRTAVKETR